MNDKYSKRSLTEIRRRRRLDVVMLSPRGQRGIEAKILASASKFWPRPRPQTFGLGLTSISLSYYVIGLLFGQKSCKIREFC